MANPKKLIVRLSQTLLCFAVASSMLIISCDDNNGKANPLTPPIDINSPVTQADLIGYWTLIKEIEGSDTEFFDMSYLLNFNQNEIRSYENNEDCMTFDYSEYTLSGNQFDSYLSYEGTKISLQGDLLIMAYSDNEGSFAAYYKRYSGPGIPSNWPATLCDNSAPERYL